MARILMEIPSDDFTIEEIRTNPQAVCASLFATAKVDIEDALHDTEAYVTEMDSDIEKQCILGAIFPEQLKEAATQWNIQIQHELMRSITLYLSDVVESNVNGVTVLLDTATTYTLKKAVLSADNCFFDFAEHFVNLPNGCGYNAIGPMLDETNLKTILEAPEWYAIIPIYVK